MHFAEQNLPCPSYPFPVKPMSTVIITFTQYPVDRFAPARHISLVCNPGSKGIISPSVVTGLSICTCVASELCIPTCQLSAPSQPQPCVSLRALFPLECMLFSHPAAFHPSHLSEGNAVLSPVSAPVQLTVEEQSPLYSTGDAHGRWTSGLLQVSPAKSSLSSLHPNVCLQQQGKERPIWGVGRKAGSSFLPPAHPQRQRKPMGRMQDCAQHMADRVDLWLEKASGDPLVWGVVALGRKCEKRWETNGLLH